jgi:outer membrane protein OmpA-like peptidoglycan-associated protein
MKKILVLGVALGLVLQTSYAGNPDRKGEAGALELNINGYARSAGFWDLNVAGVRGLEAERLNPAGVGYTTGTEINAAYTSWLTGSGVNIVQGGFSTRFKSNAFALTINSLNFGAIEKTTTNNPEGGLGIFKPTFLNIGVSYAKNFSLGENRVMGANLITGGVTLRLVSEIIGNVTATGFAFDAGLQYTTGKKENVHFGVSLRNVGTTMKFAGDGLAFPGSVTAFDGTTYQVTANKRTNTFELPTQLNMGMSYDLYLGKKIEISPKKFTQFYRLTFLGQYSANAFGSDNWGLGAEFSLREIFMLRAAYRFENGIFKGETSNTAYNGFACGMSINIPFKKDNSGPALAIDYGFRMTSSTVANNFAHTHTVGLRINVGGAEKPKVVSDKADAAPSAYENKAEASATKKKGKKGKATIEEVEEKDAAIDSLVKANKALQIKADNPVVKIDTVIRKEVVIKRDTILISLEKSDYKGGDIDTVVKAGKKVLQFNDYEALEYETGSAKIQTKSYNYLNYLVNIMKKNPAYKVEFDGHTDNVGAEETNQKLSQDRVDAVKEYFVSKGISADRINTKAFGSKKPKYKNENAAGRAKNRRVEIYMEM